MPAVALAVNDLDSQQSNTLDECELRDILRQLDELPDLVPEMPFTQLFGRLLDRDHFHSLVSQSMTQGSDQDWALRLRGRRKNLEKHVGRYLLCIFIRLPGFHYTIEVDPVNRSVVHWEWQVA